MSVAVEALITGAGLVLSIGSSLAVVSFKLGRFEQSLTDMGKDLSKKADLSDMVAIKESLAEIKGMFVLRIRNGS